MLFGFGEDGGRVAHHAHAAEDTGGGDGDGVHRAADGVGGRRDGDGDDRAPAGREGVGQRQGAAGVPGHAHHHIPALRRGRSEGEGLSHVAVVGQGVGVDRALAGLDRAAAVGRQLGADDIPPEDKVVESDFDLLIAKK
ncbi:hypothetical protein DRN50_08910 [Thermococci archaeon]|nr:MAG: hypothetical protein DRN50_08910 [Thermococci archaeon]